MGMDFVPVYAEELPQAYLVNPYGPDSIADARQSAAGCAAHQFENRPGGAGLYFAEHGRRC